MSQPNYAAKIAALLTLAEDPGATQEERDLASATASRLMIKYGIDAAMLAAFDPKRAVDDPIEYVVIAPSGAGGQRYAKEWVMVGIGIAQALGAKGFFQPRAGRILLGVAGYRSDIEQIRQLWRSIQAQATLALALYTRGYPRWSWDYSDHEKYKIRRAFIVGFGRTVEQRLRALRRDVIAETKREASAIVPVEAASVGIDLVLRQRSERIDDFVTETLNVGKAARGRQYDQGASIAGHLAGQRADIGQTTVTQHTSSRELTS